MSSSLILRKIVGSVLVGTAALAIIFANTAPSRATPLHDDVDPQASHSQFSQTTASPSTNDTSFLDLIPGSQLNSLPAVGSAVTAIGPTQDFLGGTPKITFNRDPFSGLSSLSFEANGPHLHDHQDVVGAADRADSKAWSFGAASAEDAHRRGEVMPGLPGITDVIFENPMESSVLRKLADVKYAGPHAIDFSILGIGDFMLERLPDGQGTSLREANTDIQVNLRSGAPAPTDSPRISDNRDENNDQPRLETNVFHMVMDWIFEQLSSPLGILACMFGAVVLAILAIANSIVMFRRRRQSNA